MNPELVAWLQICLPVGAIWFVVSALVGWAICSNSSRLSRGDEQRGEGVR